MTDSRDGGGDPLSSWNDVRENLSPAAKLAITQFVQDVTTVGSEFFVPPEDRIAVFDNDGTLWSEQPNYFPVDFMAARLDAMDPNTLMEDLLAAQDPETGETTAEYGQAVVDWLSTTQHPDPGKGGMLYKDMIFQPMLDLLDYLRAHGFKTYIVSGGGIEFMRPWTEETYGIPPEQVMGSCVTTVYRSGVNESGQDDGNYRLVRQPLLLDEAELAEFEALGSSEEKKVFLQAHLAQHLFVDDNVGKPVGINQFIGRDPIAAFGNSSGDQQMLEWVTRNHDPASGRKRFGLLIDHTDGDNEWDYSTIENNSVGVLKDSTRQLAAAKGWTIADMKQDWNVVYPPKN